MLLLSEDDLRCHTPQRKTGTDEENGKEERRKSVSCKGRNENKYKPAALGSCTAKGAIRMERENYVLSLRMGKTVSKCHDWGGPWHSGKQHYITQGLSWLTASPT